MNISDSNILMRWNKMASTDLGTEINPTVVSLCNLFNELICSNINGNCHSNSFTGLAEKLLLGYKINESVDDVHILTTLDLHTIEMTIDEVRNFDWWLMNTAVINNHCGYEYYQYSLNN